MKIKGTNAFEQHVEKVLLLGVVVAMLGVLAMQFMVQPNAVEVDGGDRVAPKDIFQPLATQAQRLDGRLVELDPSFPEVSSVDLQASYEAKLVEPVSPADRLAISFGVAEQGQGVFKDLLGAGGVTRLAQSGPITGLMMPALDAVYATAQWNTVDPYALEQMPVLRRYVTDRQPHDLASVSVQANLNGHELREALTSAPEGFRAIPRKLWSQTGIAVMGVEVERERLGADGEWIADSGTVPMPGTIHPSWYLGGDETLADFTEMISSAKTISDRVMRPDFPATISGPKWLPPMASQARLASYANIGDIKRLEARIADLQEDIERIRSGGTRQTTTNTPAANPGRFPGNRQTTTTQNPSQNTGAKERQVQVKMDQIKKAEDDLKGLRFEDGESDDDQSTGPQYNQFGALIGGGRRSFGSQSESILDSEMVPVWTHDLAVEPGVTYRYRIRVGVNNPLYGRGATLEEGNAEHERLAREAIAYTPWTGWSEPVLVGAREYFFVTSANEGGALGNAAARAAGEMYTMHYGYYRKATVSLNPGDPVFSEPRAPEGLVSFNTGAIDRTSAIEALANYQKSLGREDVPTSGFSSRNQLGNPDPSYPRNPGGGQFNTGGNDPVTLDNFELPDGMAALQGRLPVIMPMVLLDVAAPPQYGDAGERTKNQVFLRLEDGSVQTVVPGESGMAYAMASQSNTLSEDAWIDFADSDRGSGSTGGMNTGNAPNPFGPVPEEIWGSDP